MKKLILFILLLIPLSSKGNDSLYYSLSFDITKQKSSTTTLCFNHIGYFNKKLTKLKSTIKESSCVFISDKYIIYQTLYDKQNFTVLLFKNLTINNRTVIQVMLYSYKTKNFVIMVIDINNKSISFEFEQQILLFNKNID